MWLARRETPRTELAGPLEMPEFHPEASECGEHVDDEATAVTGVVIAPVGIRRLLNRAVDADWVADPLLFPPRVGDPGLCPRWRLAEGTAGQRLLPHSSASPASWAAVQPSWKTASCCIDSNAVLLGS